MRKGLATIVVPAYNVKGYIGRCIDSLLTQTYAEIEVIVVDDGSTDGTAGEVDRASGDDPRVRLFRNDNHGVSYSRNFAIERGDGEYLLFVDADDVVAPDYVATLVGMLSEGSCELSAVGIGAFKDNGPAFCSGNKHMYRNNEIYKACLDNCKGFLCNKGFLYYIVQHHKIRLREDIAQSEDMLFLLDYIPHCTSLAYDDGIRYGYRQRRVSAANSQTNRRWFDAVEVYEEYAHRLGGNPELVDSTRKAFLKIAYEAQWRYNHCGIDDSQLLVRIETMRADCERILPKMPLKYKAKMFVLNHFMSLEMHRRQAAAR